MSKQLKSNEWIYFFNLYEKKLLTKKQKSPFVKVILNNILTFIFSIELKFWSWNFNVFAPS